MEITSCDICGEGIQVDGAGFYLAEVGEFWNPEVPDEAFFAHAQCGLNAGLEIA